MPESTEAAELDLAMFANADCTTAAPGTPRRLPIRMRRVLHISQNRGSPAVGCAFRFWRTGDVSRRV